MAEIKSAIELAMERTRNLVMDEEEKKAFQIKETENRVRAILRRYCEGMIETNRAMDELDEIAGDQSIKKRVLTEALFEEIDITKDNAGLLALLKIMGGSPYDSFIKEFEGIVMNFSRELKKKETIIREKIENRLKEMGITGDGCEPNVEAWEEWEGAREETGLIFSGQIKEWKERLLYCQGRSH
ncbi:MAG: hypothetical protein C0392_02295 [Syntrophus sp. (in: bacteria)]|nr:hypothetical protein [Syntrophus sp. (in: bacteria)]